MKLRVIIILAFLLFAACNPHRGEIIFIKEHIRKCTADLINSQLNEKVRTKSFALDGQKFTLSIDTLGKPIFLYEGVPTESITLEYEDENYSVALVNGVITVEN